MSWKLEWDIWFSFVDQFASQAGNEIRVKVFLYFPFKATHIHIAERCADRRQLGRYNRLQVSLLKVYIFFSHFVGRPKGAVFYKVKVHVHDCLRTTFYIRPKLIIIQLETCSTLYGGKYLMETMRLFASFFVWRLCLTPKQKKCYKLINSIKLYVLTFTVTIS